MAGLEDRTRFEPAEVEPRIAQRWLDSGLHHPEPEGTPDENYSIAIPPPNVTGALHMGHALNGSIQDCLDPLGAHARAAGAKWILGTDHAGIATQTQVEKLLRSEGTSREELGREAFVERVWRWREQYGGQIIEQYKRLGATCDYDDERFTMDAGYVEAVQKVFVELYEQGLIYRDHYMVNWDPGSGSAISDLEVEQREGVQRHALLGRLPARRRRGGRRRHRAPRDDARRHRRRGPPRRRALRRPRRPRRRRCRSSAAALPVIADEYVDRDFGTGCLKITPGHDPNDFEIGRRHGLEELSAIGEDGRMTEAAGRFAGMTADEARAAVVEALEAEGRIRAQRAARPHGALLAPLGRAHRAADLPAVVHAHGRARRAGDRRRARRARAHPPRVAEPPLPRVARGDPAVVHQPPAVVGPPAAGLVPRRRDPRRHRAARGRGLGARPRRARHVVLLRAVALRDARLAARDARAARLLSRPTCCSPRATSSSSGWRGW